MARTSPSAGTKRPWLHKVRAATAEPCPLPSPGRRSRLALRRARSDLALDSLRIPCHTPTYRAYPLDKAVGLPIRPVCGAGVPGIRRPAGRPLPVDARFTAEGPPVACEASIDRGPNLEIAAPVNRSAAGATKGWKVPIEPSTMAAHLLGTCRMGDDPATSVVDRYHRAHDVPNLFMCDGSSLVTSGRGQPTMTIQALAFRAAEHIGRAAGNGDI